MVSSLQDLSKTQPIDEVLRLLNEGHPVLIVGPADSPVYEGVVAIAEYLKRVLKEITSVDEVEPSLIPTLYWLDDPDQKDLKEAKDGMNLIMTSDDWLLEFPYRVDFRPVNKVLDTFSNRLFNFMVKGENGDERFLIWLEENIPNFYPPEEWQERYDVLSQISLVKKAINCWKGGGVGSKDSIRKPRFWKYRRKWRGGV